MPRHWLGRLDLLPRARVYPGDPLASIDRRVIVARVAMRHRRECLIDPVLCSAGHRLSPPPRPSPKSRTLLLAGPTNARSLSHTGAAARNTPRSTSDFPL